jgi:hypothetical protein
MFDMIELYHTVLFMKKKLSKKRSKISGKKNLPKSASAPAGATPAEFISVPPPRTAISMPPPDWLFQQAEQEPDFRTLSAYVDSIHMLREKGFSYREIADWLSERGVDVDHNAVYRVYTNSLSDYDAHLEDLREAEEAQEEARRNA